jgi:hypothetical protein
MRSPDGRKDEQVAAVRIALNPLLHRQLKIVVASHTRMPRSDQDHRRALTHAGPSMRLHPCRRDIDLAIRHGERRRADESRSPNIALNVTERADRTRNPFENMFADTDRLASLIDDDDVGECSPALCVNAFHCVSQPSFVPHIDRL